MNIGELRKNEQFFDGLRPKEYTELRRVAVAAVALAKSIDEMYARVSPDQLDGIKRVAGGVLEYEICVMTTSLPKAEREMVLASRVWQNLGLK